jgi:hypothetical protein
MSWRESHLAKVLASIPTYGLRAGGDVAIKLDLEGGELEALKGAAETIAAARECVITVEVHPAVAKRIERDPVESLQFLESVRPFHFLVAETGERPSTSAPILRIGQTDIWNVVGWTHDDVDLRITS